MKIEIIPVQNIELSIVNGNTRVIVPGTMDPRKLVVSSFEIKFETNFESYEIDHCECIASSVIKNENTLLFTAVTQRNHINEFITISVKRKGKKRHHKIRFIR